MGVKGKSLYEITLERIIRDEDVSDTLFKLTHSDMELIVSLSDVIKGLLKRKDLSTKQLNSITKLVLGLDRMPLPTPGLDIDLQTLTKDMYIVINGTSFEVTLNGEIQLCSSLIRRSSDVEWGYPVSKDVFLDFLSDPEIEIDDKSDDKQIDWTDKFSQEFWDWIERHFQE